MSRSHSRRGRAPNLSYSLPVPKFLHAMLEKATPATTRALPTAMQNIAKSYQDSNNQEEHGVKRNFPSKASKNSLEPEEYQPVIVQEEQQGEKLEEEIHSNAGKKRKPEEESASSLDEESHKNPRLSDSMVKNSSEAPRLFYKSAQQRENSTAGKIEGNIPSNKGNEDSGKEKSIGTKIPEKPKKSLLLSFQQDDDEEDEEN